MHLERLLALVSSAMPLVCTIVMGQPPLQNQISSGTHFEANGRRPALHLT